MKYLITRAKISNYNNLEEYIQVLKDYNLQIEQITLKSEWDDEIIESQRCYIEIKTIDELFKLSKSLKLRLIIRDYYCNEFLEIIDEQNILIYDDYLE